MGDFIDDFEGPEDDDAASDEVFAELEDELAEEVSEEAPPGVRSNYRLTHKQTAHIPGPRRKPNFAAPKPIVYRNANGEVISEFDDVACDEVQVPAVEEAIDSEESDGAAPAAESVSDESITDENGHEAPIPQPGDFQKPMTFGSVDG